MNREKNDKEKTAATSQHVLPIPEYGVVYLNSFLNLVEAIFDSNKHKTLAVGRPDHLK